MEPTLPERLKTFIAQHRLAGVEDRLLVAVSGGSDSMVLVDLLSRAGFTFAIAHCNFQLRGEDSLRDEAFVTAYCRERDIPLHLIRFDTRTEAREAQLSIQEIARKLRYQWFEQIREQHGYAAIATAHHLNDSVETLLLNFCKGSGIRGLHGIPVRNGKIIRPLLFCPKEAIWQYIRTGGIRYVEDSSNASVKYTRNFLRHRVLPLLEEEFPGIVNRLGQNIVRFGEAEQLYEESIARYRDDLVEMRGKEAWIPIGKLQKVRPLSTIAYEVFRQWGFSADQSSQIILLAAGPAGKSLSSATHRLIRDRAWFIVVPLDTPDVTRRLVNASDRTVELPEGTLHLSTHQSSSYTAGERARTIALDASLLQWPLMLRRWRQGDYFYPLGMRKKKKLSRFFIDQKVPLHEKQKIWVLVSGERIAGIVGMRVDDRFKITAATTTVLALEFRPEKATGPSGDGR